MTDKATMIVEKKLEEYIEQHTSSETDDLRELNRQTHLQQLQPHMLSGHYQGVLLKQLSLLKQPQYVLEIGTFTGYSALCLAAGLQPDGELHTIDVDAEVMEKAKATFAASPYRHQIKTHVGDAQKIIPTLNRSFDMVFIDADKAAYERYYDMLIKDMPVGGLLLADNVLWKGKVLHENKSGKAAILDAFNKKVTNDSRVLNCLLPIRDGLMLLIKQ